MMIPTFLSEFVRTIILMTLTGGFLALLLLLIKPIVRHRLPKSAQYYFWLVVLVTFLIPVSRIATLPVTITEFAPIHSAVERNIITTDEARNRPPAMLNNSSIIADVPNLPNISTAPVEAPHLSEPGLVAQAVTIFMAIYPFMFALVLLYNLIGYARFVRKLRSNYFKPHPFELDMLRAFTRGKLTPRLIASDYAATPMLIGIFRPMIVLPNREYTDEQMQSILLHELTHMRRLDIAVKWLTLLACAAHWFNPLVWIAKGEIDRVCELSCDEMVIRNMNAYGKQHYGETLISVASTKKIPMPVLSTTMCEEKRALKERLTAIMKSKKHTKLAVLISAFILLGAILAACTVGAGSGNQNEEYDTVESQSPEAYSSYDSASEQNAVQLNFSDINEFWTYYRQAVITNNFETLAMLTVFPFRSYGFVYPNPVILIGRDDFEGVFRAYLAEESYVAHPEEDGTFTFSLRTNFDFILENEFLVFRSVDELAILPLNEVNNSGSIENGIARARDEIFEIVDGYWRLTAYFSTHQSAYGASDISDGEDTSVGPEQMQDEGEATSGATGDRPAYITILGEQFSTDLTVMSLDGDLTNADIAPLRYMTELTALWVGVQDPSNQITNFNSLAGLTNLSDIYFTGDYLTDITALAGLTNLTWIHIFRTQVADISPLAGLTNLETLQFGASQITDITPLAGLTNLTSLDLMFNQITDITPLAGLTNLHLLDLRDNQITDISPLAGLVSGEGRSNLTHLFLSNNQISDLTPLTDFIWLENLWLNGNPITDFSAVAHIDNIVFEMQDSE
ncbi:MAG: leucine-rich repeat domain-containing protein [Defluviitaleaceae bacterium]|nr:leucine-rich repeat domain-containing protein [Defluviitaleaceae bacterium]